MDSLDTTNPMPNSKALTRRGAAEMTLQHLLIEQLPESHSETKVGSLTGVITDVKE